jgi:hypothetical protein
MLLRKTLSLTSSRCVTYPLVVGHGGRDPRKGFHYPIYAILVPGEGRIFAACCQAALVHLAHNGPLHLGIAKAPTVVQHVPQALRTLPLEVYWHGRLIRQFSA